MFFIAVFVCFDKPADFDNGFFTLVINPIESKIPLLILISCCSHDKELFKSRFMSAYFKYLYNEFVKLNPFVQNGEGFYKLIDDVIEKEEELCNSNVYDIKLHHLPHSVVGTYHGKKFDNYMKKAREIKSLFLANTKIMNAYLDMSMFDLVLIDDANLSESEEYTKALSCNQTIFAGIYNIRVGISNDVLTKIKNNAIIDLKQRYITSPLSLVGHMERCECDFYGDTFKNDGTEVTSEDICNLVITLITQDMSWDESFRVKLNRDIKINCFVSDLNKTKQLFDDISSGLASLNISLEDIYYVLRKQINICDLHSGYLWNSEYNIIDLSDYDEENDIYENKNLISNLICAKRKLYIVDKEELLKKENKTGFVKCVDELLDVKDIIHPIDDKSCQRLAQTLIHHKIHVLGTYREYDILIQKNQKNYGIILYNAPSNYGSDILNTYRDQHFSEFPSSVIYINDLIEDYYGCIKRIIGDAKNDK